jgi:selenocysteine-specific elongation factor
MPQTLEHLETLHYFGAQGGFVVLSKADLVDDETLELAELEIRDLVQGTFLDGKDVIHFSALDQRGTESIRAAAIKEAQIISSKTADGPFRLWIDQARHVNGFGTVVSGTIMSGCLNKDDRLQLLPSGMITRSRFLESHGRRIDKAMAGQRVGINLHNVAMDQAGRGMLIASPDSSRVSYLINAELHVRVKQLVSLTNRMRVKLYIGTLVVNAMVVIMGGERISPGQSGRVQFRLSRPVPVHPKDRFAVSLMNVNSIVGGGYVLEISLEKYTNARSGKMEPVLAALKDDDVASFVRKALEMAVHRPVTAGLLQQRSGIDLQRIQSELDRMHTKGVVMDFRDKGFFLADYFRAGKENVLTAAREAIEKGRLKTRINAQEIVDTMGSHQGKRRFQDPRSQADTVSRRRTPVPNAS